MLMRERLTYAFWFVLIAVVGAVLLCAGPARGQTDGSREPTIVRVRSGGSTYGPYSEWRHVTVQPVERKNLLFDSTSLENDASAYWWVQWVSGPQACVFTAVPDGRIDRPLHPASVGGGRNCSDDDGGKCGFFMPGHWWVFAASGRDCGGYGIEECTGWCQ